MQDSRVCLQIVDRDSEQDRHIDVPSDDVGDLYFGNSYCCCEVKC